MRSPRLPILYLMYLGAVAMVVTSLYRILNPQWVAFREGEQHFFAGEFDAAIPKYIYAQNKGLREAKVYLRLGDSYLATQRFREAALVYEQMLQQLPPDKTAVQNLARLYDQLSGADRAIELYKRYESKLTYDVDGMQHLATLYKRRGEYDLAVPLFTKILQEKPDFSLVKLQYAEMLSWMRRYTESLRLFNEAREEEGEDRLLLTHLARVQTWADDPEAAWHTYEKAITAPRPTSRSASFEAFQNEIPLIVVQWEFARALGRAKHFDKALEQYRIVLKQQPALYEAKVEMATVLSWQGRQQEALDLLKEIPMSEASDKIQVFLAEYAAIQRDFTTAEARYKEYLEKHPDDKDVRLQYAQMLKWATDYEKSSREYETVKQSNPPTWMARTIDDRMQLVLAEYYAKVGDYVEAARNFTAYLDRYPEDLSPRLSFSRMLTKAKSYSAALDELDKILPLHPANKELLLERARVLGYSERYKESAKQYLELENLDPKNYELVFEHGRVLFWGGEYDGAIQVLSRIPSDAHESGVQVLLADIHAAKKEFEKSIAIYAAYLRDHPDDYDVHFKYAEVLSWSQQFTAALSEYQKILAARPNDVPLRRRFAEVLGWSGDNTRALRELEEAEAIEKKSAQAVTSPIMGGEYR